MTKEFLNKKFVELVNEQGYQNEWDVFDFSTMFNIYLDNSTIDCIKVENGEVVFYTDYNENEYEYLKFIPLNDLCLIYIALQEALETLEGENFAEGVCAQLG